MVREFESLERHGMLWKLKVSGTPVGGRDGKWKKNGRQGKGGQFIITLV